MPEPYLLFDLDGTLSDPLTGIARSINYALAGFGYPESPEEELARYIGPPLDRTFRILAGTESDTHVRELVDRFRERFGDVGYRENTLYPGIPEALEALKRKGHAMGVCTSKRGDFAQKIITMFGLEPFFDFVSGGDIGISKGRQIRELLDAGRISPGSAMIGDREMDVIAAQENGLAAWGVLWGYGSRDELSAVSPDRLFTTPWDLSLYLE